jgi:hypothetical protein
MWDRTTSRPIVPSPDWVFEHAYDGYKLVLGAAWWTISTLLFIGMIVETLTTTPMEQTLDDTTFPTGLYLFFIAADMVLQPAYVFFQILTIGSDTPNHERVFAKMFLFGWMSNVCVGFIHFCLVTRSVFSFVVVVVYINTLTWLGMLYFQYDAYVTRKKK